MNNSDKPLLELTENTKDLKEISEILIKLIDYLVRESNSNNNLDSVVLWISSTNAYVSCHWYDSSNDEIDESYNYTVANFHEYFSSLDSENEEFFYDKILEAINFIDKELIYSWNIELFQTDETNEPEKVE